MGHILHTIVEAVGANQQLAYAFVLLLAFSESLPVLGSLIPGTMIIIAIATLVPSGAIDLKWLLGSTILGAILGDGFSYWLGYHYHREITGIWPLNRYPQVVAMGQAAIERHGGKSILIARFTPPLRAIVPLVAGVLRMKPWRFYPVNIVSTIAWAVAHIVPAVIASASLAVAGAVGGRLLALIVVLALVLWLVVLLVRATLRRGLPLIGQGAVRLWLWARNHDNWVSREVLSLLDPTHQEVKGLLLLVALLAVGLWIFFGILTHVATGEPLVRMDQAVFNFMQDMRTLWADRIMVALTELGDPAVTAAVALAVALWLAARGAWRVAGYWLGAVAFAAVFVEGTALLLGLPRQAPLETVMGTLDFTSSHTAVAGTVYGMLALLAGRELKPRSRLALAIAVAVLVFLVAFSRLYLGVRWTSDIVVGLAFAIGWVAALGLVYLSHRPRLIGGGGLVGLALLVFALTGAYHASAAFKADLQRYAARPVTVHMAAQDWWRDGWARLPPRRIDLAGGTRRADDAAMGGPAARAPGPARRARLGRAPALDPRLGAHLARNRGRSLGAPGAHAASRRTAGAAHPDPHGAECERPARAAHPAHLALAGGDRRCGRPLLPAVAGLCGRAAPLPRRLLPHLRPRRARRERAGRAARGGAPARPPCPARRRRRSLGLERLGSACPRSELRPPRPRERRGTLSTRAAGRERCSSAAPCGFTPQEGSANANRESADSRASWKRGGGGRTSLREQRW